MFRVTAIALALVVHVAVRASKTSALAGQWELEFDSLH